MKKISTTTNRAERIPRLSASLATGICAAMVLLLGLLPGLFVG